jgi:hypothetical protein
MMLHVLIARVAGWIQDHQQQVITRPNPPQPICVNGQPPQNYGEAGRFQGVEWRNEAVRWNKCVLQGYSPAALRHQLQPKVRPGVPW